MVKQKEWEPFQNIPMYRAEVFGVSIPVPQDECISRLLKMRYSRRAIDVHVGDRDADNIVPVHIQWGKHTPIHTECFLAVVPTNAREARLVGKIGVVKSNTTSRISLLLIIWAILAANAFRQNEFSVKLIVMLIAGFGVMGLTALALYTIPVITRPVIKRLDSILSFAFYGMEQRPTPKPPNYMPR